MFWDLKKKSTSPIKTLSLNGSDVSKLALTHLGEQFYTAYAISHKRIELFLVNLKKSKLQKTDMTVNIES